MSGVVTYRDRVADHFRAHPLVWFDGLALAALGGAYAWRTRVSECRTQLDMTIENRERREGRRKVSEYRYVPAVLPCDGAGFHPFMPVESSKGQ